MHARAVKIEDFKWGKFSNRRKQALWFFCVKPQALAAIIFCLLKISGKKDRKFETRILTSKKKRVPVKIVDFKKNHLL